MELNKDLILPKKTFEEDSKAVFREVREMDENKKKLLEKQKRFEFHEIEGKEERKKEETKELKKEGIIKWIIVFFAALFLIVLYFWLIF